MKDYKNVKSLKQKKNNFKNNKKKQKRNFQIKLEKE